MIAKGRTRIAVALAAAATLGAAGSASAGETSKYYVAFVKLDQTIRSSNGQPGNTILETYSMVLKSAPAIRYADRRTSQSTQFTMKSVAGKGSVRIVERQPDATRGCTVVSTTVANRFSTTEFPLGWFQPGGVIGAGQVVTTGESPSRITFSGCPSPPAPRAARVLGLSGAVNVFVGLERFRSRSFGVPFRMRTVIRAGDDTATVRIALLPCPGSRRCTTPPGSTRPFN